jgi:DNA (cytosine-5)-methyltransferase 1
MNNNYYDVSLFPYEWNLEDAVFKKGKGRVFSFFSGGGGSTMGYKLAGFDVIGCNEIDPKQMSPYVTNLDPRYPYLEPIQEFIKRDELPSELYDLDILDGSFPCTTFSMSGKREEVWGVEKKYKEGNYNQVLDTLAFEFIKAIDKFRPKVIIGENVTGLLMGDAVHYIRRIHHELARIGYLSNHHVVRGEELGLPQKRHRVFITGIREDLTVSSGLCVKSKFIRQVPQLDLTFNCKPVVFSEIDDKNDDSIVMYGDRKGKLITSVKNAKESGFNKVSEYLKSTGNKSSLFSWIIVKHDEVLPTLCTLHGTRYFDNSLVHPVHDRCLNKLELSRMSSWPLDYDFNGFSPAYMMAMSVPPIMMANVATRVHEQWLSRLS